KVGRFRAESVHASLQGGLIVGGDCANQYAFAVDDLVSGRIAAQLFRVRIHGERFLSRQRLG
ncbi:MAG: hypothetical protein RBS57_13170, partial [Desulforhabdus sp.]|nr:hypothetical protein [Desulforhabdus sp.]